MNILITGATGFIGSHTCVALLNEGHNLIAFDNFSNSDEKVLDRIKEISGNEYDYTPQTNVCEGVLNDK